MFQRSDARGKQRPEILLFLRRPGRLSWASGEYDDGALLNHTRVVTGGKGILPDMDGVSLNIHSRSGVTSVGKLSYPSSTLVFSGDVASFDRTVVKRLRAT